MVKVERQWVFLLDMLFLISPIWNSLKVSVTFHYAAITGNNNQESQTGGWLSAYSVVVLHLWPSRRKNICLVIMYNTLVYGSVYDTLMYGMVYGDKIFSPWLTQISTTTCCLVLYCQSTGPCRVNRTAEMHRNVWITEKHFIRLVELCCSLAYMYIMAKDFTWNFMNAFQHWPFFTYTRDQRTS